MALSEIEKLERRYAENPQGLTFAPLAEVHRKNGDVPRALELLQPGLALHPDYIPASIVLGRCHLDLGDLHSAEAAFTHVLGLDGENVIALKALADIAERLVRFDDAERLLRNLLAIDRSNDEARDQLGRVETARRQAEAGSSASPDVLIGGSNLQLDPDAVARVDEPFAAPAPATPDLAGDEFVLDEAPADASSPPSVFPVEPGPTWPFESDGRGSDDSAPMALEELDLSVEAGPPPEGIQVEETVSLEEPVEPIAGLVGRTLGSAAEDRPDDLDDPFNVELAEDIVLQSSGGSEFRVANAAEELLASGVTGEPAPPPPVEPPAPSSFEREVPPIEAEAPEPPEPVPAAPAASMPDWSPPPTPWSAPAAEPPRHSEPDLVVTESMAELLVRQGHTAEALIVYRHLESRATGEPRYAARISELEQAGSVALPPAAEPEVAVEPAYSVRETHGQPVQAFLRGVLGARLPAAPAGRPQPEPARAPVGAEPDGAPTRPAHDSLSLSSVFGEEATPSPPAVPSAGSGSGGQGGVSFDEFFGTPGAASTPRSPRAPDSKTDDLDQFHAWLQNLKR